MTLFMALAAVYGVLQLAALGWVVGRSVRIGTLLLSIMVGLYGCGVAALVLQLLYTRGLAAASGARLFDVVQTASFTVDPFIEELVKVAPLVVVGLHVRTRVQWGLTDYVVVGAALGAGFGLLEAVLRFSHRVDRAIELPDGWLLPVSLSPIHIPDAGATLNSWLPAPASSADFAFLTGPETFLHLAWSAVAGLGAGMLLRGRGPTRLLGLAPIVFVAAEHAAVNYDLSVIDRGGFGEIVVPPLLVAHRWLWLYPLLCLAVAGWFDLRDVIRGKAALPDVRLGPEPGPDAAAIGSFALLRLPWTPLIALRFVRLRRSLMYAHARGPAAAVQAWHTSVREVRDQMDRADTAAAWQRVPTLRSLAHSTPLRRSLLNWRLLVWLTLLLPSLIYLVIGGFPTTARVQDAFASSTVSAMLTALLIAGLGWLLWQLLGTLRGLSAAMGQAYGEAAALAWFRLMSGAGSLVGGGFCLWLLVTGTGLDQTVVNNVHVLDALGSVLLAAAIAIAILGLFLFPPLSVVALAGGASTIAVTLTPALVTTLVGAGALGYAGVMLARAADAGKDGGGSAGPTGPERAGIRLDRTGKLHSPDPKLPEQLPKNWTRAELEELATDLRTSIANRKAEQLRLGENTPAGPAHRARIHEEERFLRLIQKILSGT
jgi:hypothetical protein